MPAWIVAIGEGVVAIGAAIAKGLAAAAAAVSGPVLLLIALLALGAGLLLYFF